MFKSNVKITYAESWLPIHHRIFIDIVETVSARFALKKRYSSYTQKVKHLSGNECWDQAIKSLGITLPDFYLPKRRKKKGKKL